MSFLYNLLSAVYHIISYVIIGAAAVIAVLFLIGIRPYAVRTGSMEPAMKAGSICFVNTNTGFAEIGEGDIIAFRAGDEMLVTHRAVRIDSEGITTRGDANNTEDAAKVTEDIFIGRSVFWLPYIGRIMLYAHTVRGKIVCIAAVAAFLIVGNVLDRVRGGSENSSETEQNNSNISSSE